MNQSTDLMKLHKYCEEIYEQTAILCEKYSDVPQILGSLPLSGPPQIQPDLFFISYQGGGGDGTFHKSLPRQQLYYNSRYLLGKRLTNIFNEIGRGETLRNSAGTALIFFQAENIEKWKEIPKNIRGELERFSKLHALELIRRMMPKMIIAIGSDAFGALVKNPTKEVTLYRNRIIKEGMYGTSRVIGVAHLTGCRLNSDERETINRYLQDAVKTFLYPKASARVKRRPRVV